MRLKPQHFDPRQDMRRDSFEIFHYNEPKATDVEVHHHDFYELYLFLGGQAEYWVEGRTFRLDPGDMLLINPLELHRPVVDPRSASYERIVLWISKPCLARISSEETDLSQCFAAARRTHRNLLHLPGSKWRAAAARLDEIALESRSAAPGSGLMAEALLVQFMVELNRLALQAEAQSAPQAEGSPLVAGALAYIGDHCSEELSLESIATRLSVSKYHLSRKFTEEVGVSVYRYVTLRRMLIAKQLLLGGSSAADACYACGFRDYAGFYRAFKAEYGVSPQEFAKGSQI